MFFIINFEIQKPVTITLEHMSFTYILFVKMIAIKIVYTKKYLLVL